MSTFNFYLLIAFALFGAFFIGLNLGMHGMLDFSASNIESTIMNDIKYLESKFTPTGETANAITSSNGATLTTSPSSTASASTLTTSSVSESAPPLNNNKEISATSISNANKPNVNQNALIPSSPTKSIPDASVSIQKSDTPPISANKPKIAHKIKSKSSSRVEVQGVLQSVVESQGFSSVMNNELSTLRRSASSQPIGSYIKSSGIPILLMTCNRPELLRGTLQSLLAVRGVKKEDIMVSQDGNMKEVSDIVTNEFNLELILNTEGLKLRGGYRADGAERIARHYKFSLSQAFNRRPDAAAIIIVEDDLLFSPDFYEYFNYVAPILDLDKSLFVISAWNDNGFKGKVEDSLALKRTEFFPGLGWLLPRTLYKNELEPIWPTQHWDHWLRSYEIHRGREILYPEVPRTFHNGIKGTFMDLSTHNRYFRDIDYNTDPTIQWSDADKDSIIGPALQISYEKSISDLISTCHHAESIADIERSSGVVCVWISAHPDANEEFNMIAGYFKIWHEHKRGSHRGLHSFYWGNDKYVLLLNVHDYYSNAYASKRPSQARVFSNSHFRNI